MSEPFFTDADAEPSDVIYRAKVISIERANDKIESLTDENTRLNAQVRTLGEQVEDAKITIARLKKNEQYLGERHDLNLTRNMELSRENAKLKTLPGMQLMLDLELSPSDLWDKQTQLKALPTLVLEQNRKRGYPTLPEWISLMAQIDAALKAEK